MFTPKQAFAHKWNWLKNYRLRNALGALQALSEYEELPIEQRDIAKDAYHKALKVFDFMCEENAYKQARIRKFGE